MSPQAWVGNEERIVVGGASSEGFGVISSSGDSVVEPILREPYPTYDPAMSPDGRYIAYLAREAGVNEVNVRPFPTVETGRWPIEGFGEDPLWSRDGDELFYRTSSPRMMMAVPITTEPSFAYGVPEPLFEDIYWGYQRRPYDVAPDGRFLMIKSSISSPVTGPVRQINIVRNWVEELKARVPTE